MCGARGHGLLFRMQYLQADVISGWEAPKGMVRDRTPREYIYTNIWFREKSDKLCLLKSVDASLFTPSLVGCQTPILYLPIIFVFSKIKLRQNYP